MDRGDLDGELARSVETTLFAEARRNEVVIAQVRAIALAFATLLDVLLWWQPPPLALPYPFSPANALLAGAWLLFAIVVAWQLRQGWYRPWLRLALPLVDGAMLLSLFLCILLTASAPEHVRPAVMNVGIAAALLAVTGALRLHRAAAWGTTAMAVVAFATVATLAGMPGPETLFACALLAGVGFLGMWLSDIARRSVRSEVGRLVLGRFLPPEVVQGAHEAPLALVAEPRRLEATVLVTDLRGFTTLAERLPPEDVLALLNRVQGQLASVVQANGGRVDKFMGDGMLAVFGMGPAPAPHARQALAAARAIVQAGPSLGESLRVGVGVHTGWLVAGCLGEGQRLEFTVLGDTVNTASRLQDLTKELAVEVLVSDATRVAARVEGGLRPLGLARLRGRERPMEVWTLGA